MMSPLGHKSRIPLSILALLALLSLIGCGYRLTGSLDVSSPIYGKKVAIHVFANKSYRANAGAIITSALVDEFARRSGGRVVSEEAADLILSGNVLTYATSAVSYSAADTVREYRAVMTLESTLTEKATRRVIWKGVLSWGQDYPASTNIVAQQNNIAFQQISSAIQQSIALQQNSEEAAIREISLRLAQQIYDRVTSGF